MGIWNLYVSQILLLKYLCSKIIEFVSYETSKIYNLLALVLVNLGQNGGRDESLNQPNKGIFKQLVKRCNVMRRGR